MFVVCADMPCVPLPATYSCPEEDTRGAGCRKDTGTAAPCCSLCVLCMSLPVGLHVLSGAPVLTMWGVAESAAAVSAAVAAMSAAATVPAAGVAV